MTFSVYVDLARWRRHQGAVLADTPGLVPVAKGNGYGVGVARLGAEAARLGVPAVAVGLAREVDEVRTGYPADAGDVVVLTPGGAPDPRPGVVSTVATRAGLEAAAGAGARVVVELRTSMHRHGLRPEDLDAVRPLLERVRLEGLALHLPIDRPGAVDPPAEAARWAGRLAAGDIPTDTLWVSHLTGAELMRLRAAHRGVVWRARIGTRLWLGDREALQARGTVVDVEPLGRGERGGYRQHRAPSPSWLVVVSGGTAHGVALEAPKAVRGVLPRVKVLGLGTLEAAGRNLSPFRWQGRQRWFLEPPHMQVSLLLLPRGVTPPDLGVELDCDVRMTTTHPDRVVDA